MRAFLVMIVLVLFGTILSIAPMGSIVRCLWRPCYATTLTPAPQRTWNPIRCIQEPCWDTPEVTRVR